MKSGGEKHSGDKSEGDRPSSDVFELDRLRQLIELMETHDLTEINLRQGEEKVKLRRGTQVTMAPVASVGGGATASPAPATAASAPAPAAEGAHIVTIKAPMVGTFYARPNPESQTFVKVGQRISADTVVCIIEAMKVFNEIPAEVSGQVVAVLAEDHQAVDFGRPLFKVDTSA